MENSREAMEYLVNQGEEKVKVLDVNGRKFTNVHLTEIEDHSPVAIQVRSLSSIVDYLKESTDVKATPRLIINVSGPTAVDVISEIKPDKSRDTYISGRADIPSLRFGQFDDVENFNIMLQSKYADTNDKQLLLKVTGCIQDDAVKNVGDNGVSQVVTVKIGPASVGNVEVPNPVTLAPFRTFTEIEQPASLFIFRMRTGPEAALFEADGYAWKIEAVNNIKQYLANELKGMDNIIII